MGNDIKCSQSRCDLYNTRCGFNCAKGSEGRHSCKGYTLSVLEFQMAYVKQLEKLVAAVKPGGSTKRSEAYVFSVDGKEWFDYRKEVLNG